MRVADYHAARLTATGLPNVADLGGGIGGDALAVARAGLFGDTDRARPRPRPFCRRKRRRLGAF